MSGEQLVVLALLAAAFIAGWAARDPPGRRSRGAPQPEDDGFDAALAAAVQGFERVVEAWVDGGDGETVLADFDAALARVRSHDRLPDREAAEVAAALEAGHALLEPYRRGRPLDAATSRALEPVEDRIAAGPSAGRF